MKLVFLALFLAAATALPVPEDDGGAIDVIINGVPEGEALEIADVLNIKLQEHVDGELVSATDPLHPFSAQGIAEAAAAAAAAEAIPEPANPEIEKPELPEPVLVEDVFTPEDNEVVAVVNPEPIVLPAPALPALTQEENQLPEPIVLPEAPAAEVNPEPIALPEAPVVEVNPETALPETPIVVALPEAPVVVANPEPVLPEPATPEVVAEPVVSEPEQTMENLPAQGEVFNDGLVQVTVNHQETSVFGTLHSWFSMVVNYISTSGASETNQIV